MGTREIITGSVNEDDCWLLYRELSDNSLHLVLSYEDAELEVAGGQVDIAIPHHILAEIQSCDIQVNNLWLTKK